MTEEEIIEVGKALPEKIRAQLTTVELGTLAFNVTAALSRVQNRRRAKLYEMPKTVWHVGPSYVGGWPLYDGEKHIATFWGASEKEAEINARRAAALSGERREPAP